jgi:phosphotriesterase-related protein
LQKIRFQRIFLYPIFFPNKGLPNILILSSLTNGSLIRLPENKHMINLTFRTFLLWYLSIFFVNRSWNTNIVMTVNGPVNAIQIGRTLVHEHVLVSFVGAGKIGELQWNRNKVAGKVSPFIENAKARGVKTMVECTPAYLGRDVLLLKLLSVKTGMQFITNTGYYGAVGNKYLPSFAFTETAEQLAARWIHEFENGIEGTAIRPGFIKISVDANDSGLSDLHKKLVRAAAITHLKTGLTIYSHTGPGKAAFEQLEILKKEKVDPAAFVWVHAQTEKDSSMHTRAAAMGAWVSLDGMNDDPEYYANALSRLKSNGYLERILLSQDAGYYKPEEPDGGDFREYTAIFSSLIPRLKQKGFTQADIDQVMIQNPMNALQIKIKRTHD